MIFQLLYCDSGREHILAEIIQTDSGYSLAKKFDSGLEFKVTCESPTLLMDSFGEWLYSHGLYCFANFTYRKVTI